MSSKKSGRGIQRLPDEVVIKIDQDLLPKTDYQSELLAAHNILLTSACARCPLSNWFVQRASLVLYCTGMSALMDLPADDCDLWRREINALNNPPEA